ncbi:MAG: methyl-accepting chemotaxis protein [Aquificaceae bacterium]
MKISKAINISIAILFAFSFVVIGTYRFILESMESEGRRVDYAGRQRAISQRITKLVAAKHLGHDPKIESGELVARLDKIVNSLVNGDPDLGLSPAKDEEFIAKMKVVKEEWEKFKGIIYKAEKDPAYLQELFDESEKFLKVAEESVVAASHTVDGFVEMLKLSQVFILAGAIIFLILIAILSNRVISKPLSNLADKFQDIAKGDLTVKVDDRSRNEIGLLAQSMNKMVQSFNGMISSILTAANKVISAITSTDVSAKKTVEMVKEQVGEVQQIALASEDMNKTVLEISQNASTALEFAKEAMKTALEGKEVVEKVAQAVGGVNKVTSNLIVMAESLNERARTIGNVMVLIEDIADKINLLALNAAIEAARAGEFGKGFAVVAEEIRKLAEKTMGATGGIKKEIEAVQSDSMETAQSIEQTLEEVAKVTGHMKLADEVLDRIVGAFKKVNYQINNIVKAVEEHSKMSENAVRNIEKILAIAKDIDKMSEEVLKEVSMLLRVIEELRSATSEFKIR